MDIKNLRLDLAKAKAQLRAAKDDLEVTKAEQETLIIDKAGGPKALGANAEDRTRALTVALGTNPMYLDALNRVRELEYKVDAVEALIDNETMTLRVAELGVRDKMADAWILMAGVDIPSSPDGVLDSLADALSDETTAAIQDGAEKAAEKQESATTTEAPF